MEELEKELLETVKLGLVSLPDIKKLKVKKMFMKRPITKGEYKSNYYSYILLRELNNTQDSDGRINYTYEVVDKKGDKSEIKLYKLDRVKGRFTSGTPIVVLEVEAYSRDGNKEYSRIVNVEEWNSKRKVEMELEDIEVEGFTGVKKPVNYLNLIAKVMLGILIVSRIISRLLPETITLKIIGVGKSLFGATAIYVFLETIYGDLGASLLLVIGAFLVLVGSIKWSKYLLVKSKLESFIKSNRKSLKKAKKLETIDEKSLSWLSKMISKKQIKPSLKEEDIKKVSETSIEDGYSEPRTGEEFNGNEENKEYSQFKNLDYIVGIGKKYKLELKTTQGKVLSKNVISTDTDNLSTQGEVVIGTGHGQEKHVMTPRNYEALCRYFILGEKGTLFFCNISRKNKIVGRVYLGIDLGKGYQTLNRDNMRELIAIVANEYVKKVNIKDSIVKKSVGKKPKVLLVSLIIIGIKYFTFIRDGIEKKETLGYYVPLLPFTLTVVLGAIIMFIIIEKLINHDTIEDKKLLKLLKNEEMCPSVRAYKKYQEINVY